jgi:hypothetical protein
MRWLRRVLVGVLALVVLVTLLSAGWVVKVKLENSRDEGAFIHDLDRSARGNECMGCKITWLFRPVDDDFLLAEGDRACAWLHDQPYPWASRADRFTFSGLTDRYLATNPVSATAWSAGTLRPGLRGLVVAEAWNELCGEAWELREPRNPFNRLAKLD